MEFTERNLKVLKKKKQILCQEGFCTLEVPLKVYQAEIISPK